MEHRTMDVVENVTIKLSADGGDNPDTIIFPDRQVLLTRGNTFLAIGRSSKVASKGFIASKDTAWFDNQVMSRNHAEISVDLESQKVNIRDTGSLHGTYLNESRLAKDNFAELKDGDKLRFGISVLRGQDSFAPTCVKVGIVFGPLAFKRATTPDNAFKVPDISVISDDDENSASDDEILTKANLPQPTAGISSNSIDLTQPTSSKIEYRTIIDITSPIESPSRPTDIADGDSDCAIMVDNSPSEADVASVHSSSPHLGENERRQNETATLANVWDGRLDNGALPNVYHDECTSDATDYDNESIRLSTDGEDEEGDISDPDADQMDTSSDNESDDDSENHLLEDELDSELERELQSELEWEAEYSSDDELNDEAELGELCKWRASGAPQSEFPFSLPHVAASAPPSQFLEPSTSHYDATEAGSSELPVISIMPGSMAYQGAVNSINTPEPPSVSSPNVTKKTASVSIEELLNGARPQATVTPPLTVPLVAITSSMTSRTVRLPSPSDAALAKSFAPNDGESSSEADTLGMKTGKFEFFAAREENKSKAAKMGDSGSESFGTKEAPRHDLPTHGPFSIATKVSPPPCPIVAGPAELSQESVQVLAPSEWYDRGTNFLQAPLPPSTEFPGGHGLDDEAAMTSAYTFQQYKRRQRVGQTQTAAQAPARTHVGISDIVDSCQSSPREQGNGKRKADEISETLTPAEEQYEAMAEKPSEQTAAYPVTPPSTTSDGLVTPRRTVKSVAVPRSSETFLPDLTGLPQLSVSSTQVSRTDRPAKRRRLRKIVERVGYAALGGVTVGAMVVGSLIYTAPTF